MHDGKLLSDNEVASTEARGQKASAAVDTRGRTSSRANFWTVIGFCIAGMICALFVPASYLRGEQTPATLAESPLS